MAKKQSYKVIGYAQTKNERDIEVIVKAENEADARKQANAKEPSLEKHKDVRMYTKPAPGWTRVS